MCSVFERSHRGRRVQVGDLHREEEEGESKWIVVEVVQQEDSHCFAAS